MTNLLSSLLSTLPPLIAENQDNGQRLDRFLSAHYPELSRSRLQALIEQGCVQCNDATIIDAAKKVKAGQAFHVTIPEVAASHMPAQAMALDIIYEDEDILVINKPADLTVHPAPGHPDYTLVNALLAHCGDTLSGIGGVARPGIVHRIDKDTSGLLVVAKHDAAHMHLSAQLAERTLKRVYAAIVWGVPQPEQGTLKGNIGRSLSNRQKMAVVKVGGKPAVTHYTVQQHLHFAALVECRLETGRTHQIRVHFNQAGHPLVGDPAYGQTTESRLKQPSFKTLPNATRQALLAFHRQALHAKELELVHPTSGKIMRFTCNLPEDMQGLLTALA